MGWSCVRKCFVYSSSHALFLVNIVSSAFPLNCISIYFPEWGASIGHACALVEVWVQQLEWGCEHQELMCPCCSHWGEWGFRANYHIYVCNFHWCLHLDLPRQEQDQVMCTCCIWMSMVCFVSVWSTMQIYTYTHTYRERERERVYLLGIRAQPHYCLDLGLWSCSSLASLGLPELAIPKRFTFRQWDNQVL